jgi:branched-chain amino acid transport system permease protein
MLMGPIVGGTFVAMLPFVLETLADFSFILKGVVLIAVLMFAPAGVCEVVSRPVRAWRRRRMEQAGQGTVSPGSPELRVAAQEGER